jgi:hypothetical protein
MANALDTEVKAAYETAKWNVGRSLFGNGDGVLATFEGYTSGNSVTVDSVKFMKEGLIVDIYADGQEDAPATTVRIVSVDRVRKTVTFIAPTGIPSAGFITVQNSYKREITGLGAIFDENVATLYGVSKAENKIIVPTSIDANTDIDDSVIWDAVEGAETYKNSKIDTILMGKAAYKHYIEYLRTNNVRVEAMTRDIVGGFKSLAYAFGNREIDVVYDQFVPDSEAWCLDSKALELHTQEWDFADLQGGGIFNLMEKSSIYRALLANYGDLVCTNPGGCVRIVNCA